MFNKVYVYPVLVRFNSIQEDNLTILDFFKIYSVLNNYAKNQSTYKLLFSNIEARDLFIKGLKSVRYKICSSKFYYLQDGVELNG